MNNIIKKATASNQIGLPAVAYIILRDDIVISSQPSALFRRSCV